MTPPRPEAVDDIVAAAQATLMFLVVPEPMIREFCTNLRARLDAALTAAEERAREEQREKDARVCDEIEAALNKAILATPIQAAAVGGGLATIKQIRDRIREAR